MKGSGGKLVGVVSFQNYPFFLNVFNEQRKLGFSLPVAMPFHNIKQLTPDSHIFILTLGQQPLLSNSYTISITFQSAG